MSALLESLDWANALTYRAYQDLSRELLAAGQTTNGQQSAEILGFAHQNGARMATLNQEIELTSELQHVLALVQRPQRWLVLTESWCGDAAENLPVLARLADHSPHLDLRLVLRDQHLPLMDAFLTNGGRSIPKLVAWDPATGSVLGTWGPRPAPVHAFIADYKQQHPTAPLAEFFQAVSAWYRRDATAALQAELAPLLREWATQG